ncbi:MAG TPA: D-aminoacyl-tRNA deacylase [Rectinemataceae bacterium]|nr:D-aminoacyl-tRNA deacylase [Rectinemataceae bacterium]
MRAVVQRVSEAKVEVEGAAVGAIGAGLLVYLGVGRDDSEADAAWMADKLVNLRIFPDEAGKMNRSLAGDDLALLLVSQFTLYADARKGRRPSYSEAAEPAAAQVLYERTVALVRRLGAQVETGIFQASMRVASTNEGPVTILLDSKRQF